MAKENLPALQSMPAALEPNSAGQSEVENRGAPRALFFSTFPGYFRYLLGLF